VKDKIINVIVIVVMVVIANYPLYKNLKSTAEDMNVIIKTVQSEVSAWKKDINIVQNRIEDIREELTGTINKGLKQTDNVLNKINELESEIEVLVSKIDNLKLNTTNKVKEITNPKILNNKVDSLKIKSIDKVKDLFKIKG